MKLCAALIRNYICVQFEEDIRLSAFFTPQMSSFFVPNHQILSRLNQATCQEITVLLGCNCSNYAAYYGNLPDWSIGDEESEMREETENKEGETYQLVSRALSEIESLRGRRVSHLRSNP